VLEAEDRYTLFNQPGKLRLIGWINSVNAGSFSETLANPAYNVDIATTREGRVKYGFVVNFEQAASKDFGLFSRLSWNDGKTETMSFTDVNASVSFGGVLKGTSWERPDDRIGVAGAINALSPQAKAYLAAGGLEMMIGDGKLNYSEEKIFETYYAVSVAKQATLTLDYQFIADPAYNADRGPVSVYTARFHAEF
jgi:high affinity Mn2+ porin